eukprot:PITA_21643
MQEGVDRIRDEGPRTDSLLPRPKCREKPGKIFLSQRKYIAKLLERCGMVECKSATTPMELNFKKLCGSVVGPELANPYEYRQLVGALMFLTVRNLRQHGYFDIDWVGSVVDRKSMSGCRFSLGSASISWMSRKQKSIALGSAEAEYIATSMAYCEAIWLRKLFNELFEHVLETTVIYCKNQSGICLSKNLMFHDRSKHIDIRYHFIWDMLQQGAIRLQHIRTNE